MQHDPEKVYSNYNELEVIPSNDPFADGPIPIYIGYEQNNAAIDEENAVSVVRCGVNLVHNKVNEILGENKLTSKSVTHPEVHFSYLVDDMPNCSGYYCSETNKIVIITSVVRTIEEQTLTFIHEYLHFLSHNGRDDNEQVSDQIPLSERNNIGFSRNYGIEIRKGRENDITFDYFLPFNEAVTEQLAIDILPGYSESYHDYRGLLNKVIDDAVERGLDSNIEEYPYARWTKEQCKNYINTCYFKGDLHGFSDFLKNIYKGFDITEQQFGLMTSKDDLPSTVYFKLTKPDGTPPSSSQVKAQIEKQLDLKTPEEYITDVITPNRGPNGGGNGSREVHMVSYANYIDEHNIEYASREIIDGITYDIDSLGYIIFTGELASQILNQIKIDLVTLHNQGMPKDDLIKHIDTLLFETYFISMLSEGFDEFYCDKHAFLDSL